MKTHFDKLINMYGVAPVNDFYHPVMTIEEGKAEITITTSSKHFHAGHAVHGSVYFKMLDDAAFFAAQSVVEDVFVLTSQFNTYLIRPIFEEEIVAKGEIVSRTRSTIIAKSELWNKKGKLLATGQGTFAMSSWELNPSIGYK